MGERTRARSPGRSVARWLLGTIDVAGGEGLSQLYPQAASAGFLRHLDGLFRRSAEETLLLVTDRASCHVSDAARDFRAHVGGRPEVLWLPTQSPHVDATGRLSACGAPSATRSSESSLGAPSDDNARPWRTSSACLTSPLSDPDEYVVLPGLRDTW
jgi:hypothetical protein